MSQNIDHLDERQDDDAFPIDTYTSDDDAAMYQLWLDRQREIADAAIIEAAELCREPVACRSAGEVMARVEGGTARAVASFLSVLFA